MLDDDARLVEYRLALGHAGDQPKARQPQRPGAAQSAAARAVDQPGAGDHFRQNHRDGLQRLDLDVLVAARVGMLHREHPDRAFEPDDRDAREAVVALLTSLGLVEERRVLGGLGEIEDAALRRRSCRPVPRPSAAASRAPLPCAGRGWRTARDCCRAAGRSSRRRCAIFSAMRSTTLSSLDWAEPRPAMIAWRPVRISRAEVAAESGMGDRLSDGPPRVTLADQIRAAVGLTGTSRRPTSIWLRFSCGREPRR